MGTDGAHLTFYEEMNFQLHRDNSDGREKECAAEFFKDRIREDGIQRFIAIPNVILTEYMHGILRNPLVRAAIAIAEWWWRLRRG